MKNKKHEPIPANFPVKPLQPGEKAKDEVTCGHCGLSWDDSIPTSYTPAPSARCPFEEFHIYEEDADSETLLYYPLENYGIILESLQYVKEALFHSWENPPTITVEKSEDENLTIITFRDKDSQLISDALHPYILGYIISKTGKFVNYNR